MDKDTYRALKWQKNDVNLLILSLDTRIRRLEEKIKLLEREGRSHGEKEMQKEKRHDVGR